MESKIMVEAFVHAPIEKVWEYWNLPEHITHWYHASEDWHAPSATNDLRVGGTFMTRMESTDGSQGFDYAGTYTAIDPLRSIEYVLTDGRQVKVEFMPSGASCTVTETFDPETVNSHDMQKAGWQSVLENFKKYVESK